MIYGKQIAGVPKDVGGNAAATDRQLERWQSFLATASRLYKYSYHEQVMVHAQRPDVTVCAEFDVWNNTMRRYVWRRR